MVATRELQPNTHLFAEYSNKQEYVSNDLCPDPSLLANSTTVLNDLCPNPSHLVISKSASNPDRVLDEQLGKITIGPSATISATTVDPQCEPSICPELSPLEKKGENHNVQFSNPLDMDILVDSGYLLSTYGKEFPPLQAFTKNPSNDSEAKPILSINRQNVTIRRGKKKKSDSHISESYTPISRRLEEAEQLVITETLGLREETPKKSVT